MRYGGVVRGHVPRRLAGPEGRGHRALRQRARLALVVGAPGRRSALRGGQAAARPAQDGAARDGAGAPLRGRRDPDRRRRGGRGQAGPPARPPPAAGRPPLPPRGQPLAARGERDRSEPAEPVVRRAEVLHVVGPGPVSAGTPSLARGAVPRQPAARPEPGRRIVVRLGAAEPLRRRARGGAVARGRDEPAARGEGRRRHGAEPVRAPLLGRDHGAALGALRLCGCDEVDEQPSAARRRGKLVAADGGLRGPARDGAHVPAGRGGGGRHPRDAAARAVAVGAVGDGRERRRGTTTT